MSQIHKYLEKKVFINDCQHSRNVSKRQTNKALKFLKKRQYTELYNWYHSKERLKNERYNKYKYTPIAEFVKNKKMHSLKPINCNFYKDFNVEQVNSNADVVLIDKMLHTLENKSEVANLLDKAFSLLDSNDGCIVIKEWYSTVNMMEVVDLFNLVILNSEVSLENFRNSKSLYLTFLEWKQLLEDLGYTVKDTFFQHDMYQSFYFVIQKKL